MESPRPPQRQVILLGGGQTHVTVLRAWGMRRMRETQTNPKAPGPKAPAYFKGGEQFGAPGAPGGSEAEEIMRSLIASGRESVGTLLRRREGSASAASSASSASVGSSGDRSRSTSLLHSRQGSFVPFSTVSLILVSDAPAVSYSAMASGYLCGAYSEEDMTIDLGSLCAFAGATLILGKVEAISPKKRLVKLRGGRPPLYYDVLSVCCGSRPKIPQVLTPQLTPRAEEENSEGEGPVRPVANFWDASPGGTGDSGDASFGRHCLDSLDSAPGYHVARGSGLVFMWKDIRSRCRLRFEEACAAAAFAAAGDEVCAAASDGEHDFQDGEGRGGKEFKQSCGSGEDVDGASSGGPSFWKNQTDVFTVAVIGGGAAGVEISLSLNWALKEELATLRSASGSSQQDGVCRMKTPFAVHVALLTKGPQVLKSFSPKAQALARKILESRGVEVLDLFSVTAFEKDPEGGGICFAEDGRSFACDACVVCTGGSPHSFLSHSGLPLDKEGFIRVRSTLQSEAFPEVFAAGDTACIREAPRPKAGVFAVRAAPVLERNIWAYLRGQPLVPFKPQDLFLCILVTGAKEALLCRGPFVTHSLWAWRLKRYIDENWVESFKNLQPLPEDSSVSGSGYLNGVKALMANASEGAKSLSSWIPFKRDPQAKTQGRDVSPCLTFFASLLANAEAERHWRPRCNGCASKVPADTLSAALKELRRLDERRSADGAEGENGPLFCRRKEVLSGLEHPDDASVFCVCPPISSAVAAAAMGDLCDAASVVLEKDPVLVQTVDSIRFFSHDYYCMGRVAAAHALSDLYAMGADPLTAMVVAHVPSSNEPLKENALVNLVAGCASLLTSENCQLVGGHSAEVEEGQGVSVVVTGRLLPNESQFPRVQRPLVDKSFIFPKGSYRVTDGCVLILTKALGTGVIFAAHMRAKANALWVEEALQQMQQTNREAMLVFRRFGARACTDVSGFGLAGHLAEMIEATNNAFRKAAGGAGSASLPNEKNIPSPKPSAVRRWYSMRSGSSSGDSFSHTETQVPGVRARLWLERIPTLPGVVELTMAGVVSSLFFENAKVAKRVRVLEDGGGGGEQAPLGREGDSFCSPGRTTAATTPAAVGSDGGAVREFSHRSFFGGVLRRRSAQKSCLSSGVLIFPLLFDPQTSGGLLAAVPPETAAECLKALRALGPASAIGRIVANEEGTDFKRQPVMEVVP